MVLRIAFFQVESTFSIFFLDFYFPFLLGLLFPFSLGHILDVFKFLFFLIYYFPFQIGLCSSVECKGIIGNDGRHYILDLLRTFPPDLNFLELEEIELSKEAKALGFPIVHKHKLCCLRQELIDAFVESRYMMFIKYAAVHLQQLGNVGNL